MKVVSNTKHAHILRISENKSAVKLAEFTLGILYAVLLPVYVYLTVD